MLMNVKKQTKKLFIINILNFQSFFHFSQILYKFSDIFLYQ